MTHVKEGEGEAVLAGCDLDGDGSVNFRLKDLVEASAGGHSGGTAFEAALEGVSELLFTPDAGDEIGDGKLVAAGAEAAIRGE